ncbi:hypothetical protein ASD04_11860 [Devosia sp. Root436]|nr:hypothetical protein ASD04_11860 [Devosia sp. Root436]
MGIHYGGAKPQPLNDFYALDDRYWRKFLLLSDYQQDVVLQHVGEVGAELNSLIATVYDLRRIGRTVIFDRPTLLQRLVKGEIDEAIMVGDHDTLQLILESGQVVVSDLIWHKRH